MVSNSFPKFVDILFSPLGKVHDFSCVGVNSDGTGHGGRGPILWAAGEVWALAGVVLLLDQVVTSPESHEVSIVSGRRDRDGSCAADVSVTKLKDSKKNLIKMSFVKLRTGSSGERFWTYAILNLDLKSKEYQLCTINR